MCGNACTMGDLIIHVFSESSDRPASTSTSTAWWPPSFLIILPLWSVCACAYLQNKNINGAIHIRVLFRLCAQITQLIFPPDVLYIEPALKQCKVLCNVKGSSGDWAVAVLVYLGPTGKRTRYKCPL